MISSRSMLADLGAGEVPLSSDLQKMIRMLPKDVTGSQLVSFMNHGLELSYAGGFRLTSSDAFKARQKLSDAINSPASIGIEIPWWPFSTPKTYRAGDAPREKAISLVTKTIGETSGDIGVTEAKIEAVKELARDLTKPPFGAPDWATFFKRAVLVVVGVGVVAVAGGLLPKLTAPIRIPSFRNPSHRRRRRRARGG